MLSLRGELVVVGKSPDGDSIRFIPRSPALLRSLAGGGRVDPSADGSVQLRLDGIDAPELHYNGLAQPLAEPAPGGAARVVRVLGRPLRGRAGRRGDARPHSRRRAVGAGGPERPPDRPAARRRRPAGRRRRRRRPTSSARRTSRWPRPARPTGRSTRPRTRRSAPRSGRRRHRGARGPARRLGAGRERGLRAALAGLDRPGGGADPAQALPPLLGLPARRLAGDAAGVAAAAPAASRTRPTTR